MLVPNNKRAFTLIELLVVVAIIGILAALGVVAYNGYTASAKKKTTLSNLAIIEKFINHTLAKCDAEGLSTIKIGSYSINCTGSNTKTFINSTLDTFMAYFKSQGFKNPYNPKDEIIVRTGSGGDSVDGRLRFDETTCPGQGTGQSYTKSKITIIAKTHDETKRIFIEKDGWCN
jgi:type IV pilus assembly protein PilA